MIMHDYKILQSDWFICLTDMAGDFIMASFFYQDQHFYQIRFHIQILNLSVEISKTICTNCDTKEIQQFTAFW